MAETILFSSVNKSDSFPKKVSVEAPHNCGSITVIYSDSYTEQMIYELPNIHIDIYTTINGQDSFYKFRSLSVNLNDRYNTESFVIYDIPKSCILYIYPDFDNSAFISHNETATIFEDTTWETPIKSFPLTLVWNNDNFLARCSCSSSSSDDSGGDSGGDSEPSGVTPPTITIIQPQQTIYTIGDVIDITITVNVQKGTKDVKNVKFIVNGETVKTVDTNVANGGTFSHTINNVSTDTNIEVNCTDGNSVVSDKKDIVFDAPYFYTVSATDNISSTSNFQEVTVNENGEKEFTVFANNEYIIIAYESMIDDLVAIKDNSGFNNIYSFNKSVKTIGGKEYKLYISETPVTCINFTYYIQ